MELAFVVVKLIEVDPTIWVPHALAADIVACGVRVEMVVGHSRFVVPHLFDQPPFLEALEAPTVIAVDQDLAGPSRERHRAVAKAHSAHLMGPHWAAVIVDSAVGWVDRLPGVRRHLEQAV